MLDDVTARIKRLPGTGDTEQDADDQQIGKDLADQSNGHHEVIASRAPGAETGIQKREKVPGFTLTSTPFSAIAVDILLGGDLFEDRHNRS
ncbi:MAG TPA: hypothetical protein ENI62_01125 [Gammaproteobacteria bacterium]|nr:hypothetical protein [Gammaproteobacteria bacterium]